MKNRIWELDALRGLGILAMVAVHAVYDASELFGLIAWEYPPAYILVKDWGGVVFFLLSGICATFSRRSIRRGVMVFACGLGLTAVTAAGYFLGLADGSLVISFGVLHCLGLSMVLWKPFRNMPAGGLALLGVCTVLTGFAVSRFPVDTPWLIPFGLAPADFSSADYFPCLPNFGYFLLGAALGKRLYPNKETRFPGVGEDMPIFRFLQSCGRCSLPIYLLHQPVILLVLALF